MNNNKIVIKTDSGEELIYDIVAMVTNKVGSRNYVYFTNKEKDAEGNDIVYGCYFVNENNQIKLINDLSDEDFESIKTVYDIICEEDATSVKNASSNDNIGNNQNVEIEVL